MSNTKTPVKFTYVGCIVCLVNIDSNGGVHLQLAKTFLNFKHPPEKVGINTWTQC